MTARDEIVHVGRMLAVRSVAGTFDVAEVLAEPRRRHSPCTESTIRTHVTSRMCANAPDNHATVYPVLVRVSTGRPRLSTAAV